MVKFLTQNGVYKRAKESYYRRKLNKKTRLMEQDAGFAHLNNR